MGTDSSTSASPTWMIWAGRVMTAAPVVLLTMSAWAKLSNSEQAVEGFRAMGYADGAVFIVGVVELVCTILYVVPQTAVLGAILLTGYLGGATATHASQQESVIIPIAVGVVVWGGLFLRDARIRALMPIRRGQ